MKPSGSSGRVIGNLTRLAVLIALGGLTYGNATTSKALSEAIEAEARGDFVGALRGATAHLARRPWSLEASRVMARCLSRLDFAEEAEPYYRKRMGVGPSAADLRYRAYGLTRANLRERALRAFDEVLALEPDDLASLRLKAGLLISMERWVNVLEVGRRLSSWPAGSVEFEAPVPAGGHWTLKPRAVESVPSVGATLEAIAWHNQGEPIDAIRAYERVLEVDPGFRSMPLDRRLFWSQFGEDLLAVGRGADLIRLASVEDPTRSDPGLVVLQARAWTQGGSVEEAEACWRRVMEIAPERPSSWLNLGRLEATRGNSEEAARLLTRAAELAPEVVDAPYNLGLIYRRLGRIDEARKWEGRAARVRARLEEKERKAPTPPTHSEARS